MRGARPDAALAALFAREHPLEGDGVAVLALSGGADSTALAGLAAALAPAIRTRLLAVHVNHGVRASAEQDEGVACAVAAHLGLPYRVMRVAAGRDDEATLRTLRYDALVEAARESGARSVLTAHNAQDQTETVLMALFRGTGKAGLRGMPVRRALAADVELVRPLLRADAATLRGYCEREHLPYAIDPTNADARYRRNALRRLLVEMRRDYPGLDRAVSRCARMLAEEA